MAKKEVVLTSEQALARMRRLAGGLLICMTVLFLLANYLESLFPKFEFWIGFVRTFAEAAMVGGIADWFAVTALFRRPLGLPIPHTAILPNKKDSIGRSLGSFVENNFLTEEALEEKLKNLKISEKLEEWLAVPENSDMVAFQISKAIPSILNVLDDKEVRMFIEKNIATNVSADDIAEAASNLISLLTANNKHHELFNEVIKIAQRLLDENKDSLRVKIKEEIPWYVPEFVQNKLYQKMIAKAEQTFMDVIHEPDHPMRKKFSQATDQFIKDLKTSPEAIAKIEQLKQELLQNPTVQNYLEQVFSDFKQYIIENLGNPDSMLQLQLKNGVFSFFKKLIEDENMRTKITSFIYKEAIKLASTNRHEIGSMISNTIAKWDKETLTTKLELQVGKDLQYIRISGTLVGGTVGLLIHLATSIIEYFTLKP